MDLQPGDYVTTTTTGFDYNGTVCYVEGQTVPGRKFAVRNDDYVVPDDAVLVRRDDGFTYGYSPFWQMGLEHTKILEKQQDEQLFREES